LFEAAPKNNEFISLASLCKRLICKLGILDFNNSQKFRINLPFFDENKSLPIIIIGFLATNNCVQNLFLPSIKSNNHL